MEEAGANTKRTTGNELGLIGFDLAGDIWAVANRKLESTRKSMGINE